MRRTNPQRKSCKDVFNAFLVKWAIYAGFFEFPRLRPTFDVPSRIIAFSKALSCKDYDQWIHFYEYDYLFERVWRKPRQFLSLFKKFKGVILPDFSLYRDMPLVMQLWNIYRSRAIGHWLQSNGIKVIPNIRYGDKRTFRICCEGLEKHGVIAVGSHGTMKHKTDREIFLNGLDVVISILQPSVIVVYGTAPDKYFKKYIDAGIKIIQFESDYSLSHKEGE
jgi:hypothetical protein